jgi:outer membrane protein assembly factor BamB
LALSLLLQGPAFAIITRLIPLREALASERFIFAVKVGKLDPDRPGMVLQVTEDFKGKAPFRRLAISLTADGEGQRQGDTSKLLKRLAPDLPLIVFASQRGKRHTAFAFTNGTWFQMIGQSGDEPAKIHWNLTHCEPYLRRTFKGTTAELREIILDGLAGRKKPPEPDPKEPPGLGPELKREGAMLWRPPVDSHPPETAFGATNASHTAGRAGPLFAVIPTFVIIGPLALLAALFPVLLGGLALVMRRWRVFFWIASFNTTLYLAHFQFHGHLKDGWWGKPAPLWGTLALIGLVGTSWSGQRQKKMRTANPDHAVAGPSRGEQIILWTISLAGLAVVTCWLGQESVPSMPWKELLLISIVPWVGSVYVTCLGFIRKRQQTISAWPSTERVLLWALTLVCIAMAAMSFPVSMQADGLKLVWTFEPKERGAIISSPTVQENRLYAAVIQGTGFSTYGVVYCLNRETGEEVWQFDDDGAMQQVFSSPCVAAGRLYIGEGLHENHDCKFYCVDAATGQKLWHFQTTSHIESSPCVADGRVYFGAGSAGIYCLDAITGAERWHFQNNLHIDASPKVSGKRVYAGSGVSRTQKETRVFCLDADSGGVIWQHPAKLPVWSAPCILGNRAFFGLGNGRYDKSADRPAGAVLSVDVQTGKEIWCYDLGEAVLRSPAADDDRVYFGSRDNCCYCIAQKDGQLRWKTDLGSAVLARPMAQDNSIYVVSSAGRVCRLEADTGEPMWRCDIGNHAQSRAIVFASPARDDLHHLYVGAALEGPLGSRAVLYCLQDSVEAVGSGR